MACDPERPETQPTQPSVIAAARVALPFIAYSEPLKRETMV